MMKIALIKEKQRKINTTSRYSIHNEEDLSHQNREESSEIRR
jgi:hypothetical protein